MEWTLTVLVFFIAALCLFGAICEHYAPKVMEWIEKQVTR